MRSNVSVLRAPPTVTPLIDTAADEFMKWGFLAELEFSRSPAKVMIANGMASLSAPHRC
jgi:hypothetical protein